jgi:protein ImuB
VLDRGSFQLFVAISVSSTFAGRASEAIASLPIAALRLPEETVSSLREVGIERVAQLASKPRATVPVRFGVTVLTRLDQALGSAEEALVSLDAPELPRCELRFAEPLGDAQDLQRVIALLAGKLCHELERKGIGARRLDLAFTRVDNIAQAVRVGLSRPQPRAETSRETPFRASHADRSRLRH